MTLSSEHAWRLPWAPFYTSLVHSLRRRQLVQNGIDGGRKSPRVISGSSHLSKSATSGAASLAAVHRWVSPRGNGIHTTTKEAAPFVAIFDEWARRTSSVGFLLVESTEAGNPSHISSGSTHLRRCEGGPAPKWFDCLLDLSPALSYHHSRGQPE